MLSFLILAMAPVILALIVFACYKSMNQARQFADQMTVQELTLLHKAQETEQALRQEISNLKNQLQQTAQDPVTKLLSRQLFEDRLSQALKESERYHLTLGVLFIDIDDFKIFNEALGYEIADTLLHEVGSRLQTCIRQVDSLSRFSKDTFAVLLTQLAKPETAAVVAQRMLLALAEPFKVKDQELYTTACIGIAIYPSDGPEATHLLQHANQALHLAKKSGNHIYQFYQGQMYVNSQRELALCNQLKRETLASEFVLYYQPIFNTKTETIFAMDALVHWQHPDVGLVNPQELFIHAERQRKLNMISEWVFKKACQQYVRWRSLGFAPTFLGVPLSLSQLENSHFIYRISQLMQEAGFKPDWLLLEIKEGSDSITFEALEKAFNMLKYLGVHIAIDHFGAGLFSLSQLKNVSVNYLKLDASLINDITQNPQAVALLKSLMVMAKNLSFSLIIQGVEQEEQVSILKEIGCFYLQGQLLGAPIPEKEIEQRMTVP